MSPRLIRSNISTSYTAAQISLVRHDMTMLLCTLQQEAFLPNCFSYSPFLLPIPCILCVWCSPLMHPQVHQMLKIMILLSTEFVPARMSQSLSLCEPSFVVPHWSKILRRQGIFWLWMWQTTLVIYLSAVMKYLQCDVPFLLVPSQCPAWCPVVTYELTFLFVLTLFITCTIWAGHMTGPILFLAWLWTVHLVYMYNTWLWTVQCCGHVSWTCHALMLPYCGTANS